MSPEHAAICSLPRMFYLTPDDTKFGPKGYNNCVGLLRLLRDIRLPADAVAAEIGSYAGVSAEMISGFVSHLHCIDPWPADFGRAAEAELMFDCMRSRHQNIKKWKQYSHDLAPHFPSESFDLVYIDALHKYERVAGDINDWWSKVKVGGYLAGHDLHLPGVAKAVRERFGPVATYSDTSWVVRRQA